jgi:two-component SAPR family response regulator
MPHINGFGFTKEIRHIYPDINVVLITAFEIREHEFNIVFPSLKVNELIKKPIIGSQIL